MKPNDMTKNWVDPEAKAEAERYDNPIPSRTLILDTLEQLQTPQSHAELVDHFHIQDQPDTECNMAEVLDQSSSDKHL